MSRETAVFNEKQLNREPRKWDHSRYGLMLTEDKAISRNVPKI
jgi:hypothetical protein